MLNTRIIAGFVGLLLAGGIGLAADPPTKIVIKPDATGTVKVGQSVYFAYPYEKDHTTRLKRALVGKEIFVGLKEVHTGPADKGENNVLFKPNKVGTFKVTLEVFVGTIENGMFETYKYNLVVKKKNDDD
ncbi:hypothetical protein AYO40_01575 [Planctomycetaceae bacterium SCGC AG-212-D15]|nr:hypothetical protein AYO40_01575 [Planctomycetaceae bacterium SCGC AG-212-D15]